MPSILAYGTNAILYAILGAVLARGFWRSGPVNPAGFLWVRFALLIPLGLQAWLLYEGMFAGPSMFMGVGNALSCIVWVALVIYWGASFFYRLEGMQALVVPIAAVAAFMPLAFPPTHPVPNAEMTFFRIHLALSILAYSLFTIASLHVLVMAVLERRLHSGALPPVLRNLPPLLAMEKVLFQIIVTGFVLLTASLASGMFFAEELFGRPLAFNHKTVFAILSWLIFGALLAGRHFWGWRGRVAMRWTLAGFLALVLAYIGSKFVLEILLRR
ncbi:MAG: cytochrome C biogenesis protein [Betaproteobacteria bacterium]|nr:cytochrome C biogenesis protein [Betaproteobacteria bacterium]